jgi:tRNA modification GTPase
VVATFFAAPHSYTTEDVVEISAHGSPALLQRLLTLAIDAGARLAEPGEFTLRAYLGGRLDLVQAEAVADLVDAVTPLQARVAMDQLEGTLTAAIGALEAHIFDVIGRLEASLDFPEEGFHFITREAVVDSLDTLGQRIESLMAEGQAGRVLREGRMVVIVGAPNAGKSTLFNALVGSARAIVTDVPGTTRDVLTERVDVNGLPLTLIDTAGLREAADAIEAEGVRRAEQARDVAALTLFALDSSTAVNRSLFDRVAREATGPVLVAATKADLAPAWSEELLGPDAGVVAVSAHTGAGLDELRSEIVRRLTARDDWRDPPAVSNIRHLGLLREAATAVGRAAGAARDGATEEIVVHELGAARTALEQITGQTTADDLLHHIFARFCVGK